MFGGVQDIHEAAAFKVAVPDVEVAVDALDRRVAAAELAAVEGVVVVVELRADHAPAAQPQLHAPVAGQFQQARHRHPGADPQGDDAEDPRAAAQLEPAPP